MLGKNLKYLQIKVEDRQIIDYKKTIFLKHFITNPFIEVGDFTYYDGSFSNSEAEDFENKNVLYYPTKNTRLKIGKFCCLASDCKFMRSGAQHHVNSFTTYPLFWGFNLENPEVKSLMDLVPPVKHYKTIGDTIIGNDVWIGYDALIMPGVKIGDGAIIGTRALVTKNVEPYAIVGGNPAKVIRKRFNDEIIAKLLKIQWWNWEIEKIMENYQTIMDCDIDSLLKVTK